MELRAYINVLRRWEWLITAVAVVSAVTAGIVSLQLPKTYASTTEALVSPKQVLSVTNVADPNQLPNVDQLVLTYLALIDTDPVRRGLVKSGVPRTADELRGRLTAVRVPDTTLIQVTAHDRDPAVALLEAQNVISNVNISLRDLQAKVPGASQNSRLEALVPWEVPTQRPTVPVSPNIPQNILLALGGGLLLGIGIAFSLERLDTTIKAETDVRLKLSQPLLGSIFNRPVAKADVKAGVEIAVVGATRGPDPVAEQYRALRTNIMFSRLDQSVSTIAVTSTLSGEGKSTTACNLAVVMAQAGFRVILVDADLRRPSLHRVFGLQRNTGLGNLTLEGGPVDGFLSETDIPNLRVLCSGPLPPNPSELLGSNTMQRIIGGLKATADVLIFDTPPIGTFTDATVLGAMVDGVVLVVEYGRTPINRIFRSLETLDAVGIRPLGVLLNKSKASEQSDSYFDYYADPNGAGGRPPGAPAQRPEKAKGDAATTATGKASRK